MTDVPDPLAGIDDWPMPPRRAVALADSPTRARVGALRAKALAAALLYELAWVFIISKREDLHTMPRTILVTEVAIPLVATLLALAAAAPGALGMGHPKGRLASLVLLAPAFFVVATLVASPHDVDTAPFLQHGVQCFAWTALFSFGPMVFAAWAFRRSFVAAPAWRSAALGLACGAIAAATMSLVCSVGSAAHVLVGHGAMMLVAAIGGGLLGRRFGRA